MSGNNTKSSMIACTYNHYGAFLNAGLQILGLKMSFVDLNTSTQFRIYLSGT